ncbi:MAG: sigma-70 family RNA polymerase sigma factor, partial [Blastochloris sp.]|nr:sigma-70 family RNA polymerase sigma factor [Blastochloris sp.]
MRRSVFVVLKKATHGSAWRFSGALLAHDGASASVGQRTSKESHNHLPSYVDEDARTVLISIYTEFIKAQVSPAATKMMALDDITQQVWLRFWRAANHGLDFPTLSAALNYLKQTTISTLIESQRQARKRLRDESLQQLSESGDDFQRDGDSDLFSGLTQQRFRSRCREVLSDPLEYRVFWMRYSIGLPPRVIARDLEKEGVQIKGRTPTAGAISDMLDRVFRRLRADKEVQDLLRAINRGEGLRDP